MFPWKSAVDRSWKKLKEDFNFGKMGKVSKQLILCGERKRSEKE
jgi:hypothetical protein